MIPGERRAEAPGSIPGGLIGPLPHRYVLGARVDCTTYAAATTRILEWAAQGERGYVCAANVHMVMEAYDSPEFRQLMNQALLVSSDGMPLVWALQALGLGEAERVYGPTLMLHLCAAAAEARIPIGLYGGSPPALADLNRELARRFPSLSVVCALSPPFRELDSEEDEELTRSLARSGARLVFVGLGCPKQERWMASHTQALDAVLVGVGAAFDFHAGRVRQAPALLQRAGLEWAFRLAMEPRRLWRRYAWHNPRFMALFAAQLLGRGVPMETT